jgi:hypothetical protein
MGHRSDGFEVPGRSKPQGENSVELYMAGPDYFATLGIPRVAGRDLGEENPAATKVGVVNEEFVRRFFQGENPVGHMVTGAGVPYQIVGVVKDTKARARSTKTSALSSTAPSTSSSPPIPRRMATPSWLATKAIPPR